MDSPLTRIHFPKSASRSTHAAGISPSPVGPTFSRKLPPLLAVSISMRISLELDRQLTSSLRNPHVSLIVMHVSQSTPGRPVAGIFCSGVPKSPADSFFALRPPPLRVLP